MIVIVVPVVTAAILPFMLAMFGESARLVIEVEVISTLTLVIPIIVVVVVVPLPLIPLIIIN